MFEFIELLERPLNARVEVSDDLLLPLVLRLRLRRCYRLSRYGLGRLHCDELGRLCCDELGRLRRYGLCRLRCDELGRLRRYGLGRLRCESLQLALRHDGRGPHRRRRLDADHLAPNAPRLLDGRGDP